MHPSRRAPFLAAIALLVSACASKGSFPSLAPRPVESLGDGPAQEASVPAAASDPALRQDVDTLIARANGGQRAFDGEISTAERTTAQAGAPGSESWLMAQQAVSRLEAARAETVEALALLDQLAVERAAQATNPDDFQAILNASEKAGALAAAQQASIDRLRARIAP